VRSRILIGLITGAVGGFLGWLLQENLIHYRAVLEHGVCTSVPLTGAEHTTLALCTGGIIGMFLGSMDGIVEGSSYKLRRGVMIGLIAGFLIGGVGLNLGGAAYAALGGSDSVPQHPSLIHFLQQMIARSAGMTLLGVAVGVGSSLSTMSGKSIRNGAIGGLLGGMLGGFLFDILPSAIAPVTAVVGDIGCHEAGATSRAVGFISIGAFTGFFIGLVQELLKDAWVKVLAGRNEGKDFILSRPMNILGRDEKCDVPLYGDSQVATQHAAIRAEGHRHVLIDAGAPAGTLVNGQALVSRGEQMLRDGDMIQIGSHRILFREKSTASKYARGPADEPKTKSAASAVPMPSHLCPYCGSTKDGSGKCLCNIEPGIVGVGSSLPGLTPGYAAQQFGMGAPFAPAVQAMPSQLICVEGPYAGQGFALGGPNISVGREDTNDISLRADTTVSRNHARLVNEGGGFTVYDNSSSNGTFVNGVRVVSPVHLASGDMLQFGASKFRVE